MPQPLVSIIIPCFNCAKHITDALDSIYRQNYPNIEVIVIDDGSNDESTNIITHYKKNIKIIKQSNMGPANARNNGINHSNGSLIAFLDADDIWLPNKLQTQVDLITQDNTIDIIFGNFGRITESASTSSMDLSAFKAITSDTDSQLSGYIYHEMLLDNRIHIITSLIRRTLFDSLDGFDTQFRTGEDYDFWLRATYKTKVLKLKSVVALYRINPHSTTYIPRVDNNEEKALQKAIKTYGIIGPDGRTISNNDLNKRFYKLNINHAYIHFTNKSFCIAGKYFIKALSFNKKNIKLIAHILISFFYCIVKKRGVFYEKS